MTLRVTIAYTHSGGLVFLRHLPITVWGLLATEDPAWLLCTLPYIPRTEQKDCQFLLHQHLFWGRGVGFSTPKRRTEFSLVSNLLHNTSDCYEIETILPIALRHLKWYQTWKEKTIDTQVTLYIEYAFPENFQWLESGGRRVCVCAKLISPDEFYCFIAGHLISVFV